MDQHARANLYLQAQRIHHDEALECPGVWLKLDYAASPGVHGMS